MLKKDSYYAKMIPSSILCKVCGADNNIMNDEIIDSEIFSPGSDENDHPSEATTEASL